MAQSQTLPVCHQFGIDGISIRLTDGPLPNGFLRSGRGLGCRSRCRLRRRFRRGVHCGLGGGSGRGHRLGGTSSRRSLPPLPVVGLLEVFPPLPPVEGLLEELPPVGGLPSEVLLPVPLLVGSAVSSAVVSEGLAPLIRDFHAGGRSWGFRHIS